MNKTSNAARIPLVIGALLGSMALSACAPLLLGGAVVGTTLMVTDRRSSGAQVEDQGIELKALTRIREAVGERGHISVTSYNRLVLLTGEVQSEDDKAAVERAITRIENVKSTVNELLVGGSSSLTSRSNDTIITSKVKASFLDAGDMPGTAVKVVTERGTVYLMGRVTEREANRAAEVARGVGGVTKVIKVFEPITEAELADLSPKSVPKK